MESRVETMGFDYDAHWKKSPCKECKWQMGHSDTCSIYKKWCKENC
jgi:hypothetical protein